MLGKTQLARAVLIALALCLTSASGEGQRASPQDGEAGSDKKVRVEDDGESKLEYHGTCEDIPLSELVSLYTVYKDRRVVVDPMMIAGKITVVAPLKGAKVDAEELLLSALAKFRLTLIAHDDFDQVVSESLAATSAETVTLSELDKLPAHKFVRTVVPLRNTPADEAADCASKLVTKFGGVVQPVEVGNLTALVLCDYAGNIQRIIKLLSDLETALQTASRVIKLKHASVEDVIEAVRSAALHDVSVGSVLKTNLIVLTGELEAVERVAKVTAELDVAEK